MKELKCSNETPTNALDKKFWDERWKKKETRWDLKVVSPPLKIYFDEMTCKNKSILIPGCGNAYEAQYLLENGFKNITIIDISPTAVNLHLKKFKKYAGQELSVICGDFFKHTGQYDFIIEQTFFCALEKSRRVEYAIKMKSLLSKEGKLAGLLFDKEFENSPPFGGSKKEYQKLFSNYFDEISIKKCLSSISERLGTELFFEIKNN